MAYQDRPEELEEVKQKALDDGDIQLLKTYGQGPYTKAIKALEKEVDVHQKKVNALIGVVDSGMCVRCARGACTLGADVFDPDA